MFTNSIVKTTVCIQNVVELNLKVFSFQYMRLMHIHMGLRNNTASQLPKNTSLEFRNASASELMHAFA